MSQIVTNLFLLACIVGQSMLIGFLLRKVGDLETTVNILHRDVMLLYRRVKPQPLTAAEYFGIETDEPATA